MSKNNKIQSFGFGLFKFFIRFIIAVILIAAGITLAALNGFDIPSAAASFFGKGDIPHKVENVTSILSDKATVPTSIDEATSNKQNIEYEPLSFLGKRQLVLNELDSLGRATAAHIQLRDKDEPTDKRDSKITYDPVGWHNYKYNYVSDNGDIKKAFLMNRGHLIGYQFSGLNSEPRNLVPQTRYLNAGTMDDRKIDSNNPNSQIFYEQLLDRWLKENPDKWLDLKVVAIYQNEELIPRKIKMYWVGLDANGEQIKVELKKHGNETPSGLLTSVTLDNYSPNATINYLDGTATPLYK